MQRITTFWKSIIRTCRDKRITTPEMILIGAIIISLSILAHGVLIRNTVLKELSGYLQGAPNVQNSPTPFTGKAPGENEYVSGPRDNDVFVIEYSDTECPYCLSLYPTLDLLQQQYKDKITFIYRHFPLTSKHPGAFPEAVAITCAGNIRKEKRYYDYMNAMLSYKYNKNVTTISEAERISFATNLGIDKTAFTACLQSQDVANAVEASITDGLQAGVKGTPATYVVLKTKNGYEVVAMLDGAQPYDLFKVAIDEALSR
mgnify:FL=1